MNEKKSHERRLAAYRLVKMAAAKTTRPCFHCYCCSSGARRSDDEGDDAPSEMHSQLCLHIGCYACTRASSRNRVSRKVATFHHIEGIRPFITRMKIPQRSYYVDVVDNGHKALCPLSRHV